MECVIMHGHAPAMPYVFISILSLSPWVCARVCVCACVCWPSVLHPIIPHSCVCCCQGNPNWLASRKQNLITICHPLPSPLIPSRHPSLSLCINLSYPFISSQPSLDGNKKMWPFDRYVRPCLLSLRHVSIKFSLSESVWSSWPAETKQSDPGLTVVTSP